MSNKGEDVKQLFAHLGLDPSSYRDLKDDSDEAQQNARSHKKRAASKAKPPVTDPAEAPPPPRVQQEDVKVEPAEASEMPPSEAAPPAPVAPKVTEGPGQDSMDQPHTEPAMADSEEFATVAAMPDRWSLLATVGSTDFPVAEIDDEPADLGNWHGRGDTDQVAEEDTDRLRRAGSLAALVRGTERVAQTARQFVSGGDSEPPRDEQVTSMTESVQPDSEESVSAAAAEPATQELNDTVQRSEATDPAPQSATHTDKPPRVAARPASAAIAKLMGRLGQPPAQHRTEGAKLKLNYERRQAPVVAETQLDQRLPSVFGRLEKSRVE